MSKVAIYPGTFDPITYGHIDVIKKALKLFDTIIVGVSNVSNKNYLFSSEERIDIVKEALFKDLKLNKKKILVVQGGISSEREISLKSGKACIRALRQLKHKVLIFDPF